MSIYHDALAEKLGPLSAGQIAGIDRIRTAASFLPLDHQAYILATVWHETGRKMQPVYEKGAKNYFRKYEPETRIGRMLGNRIVGDGFRFRGRGDVQLTGRRNYAVMSEIVGRDLVANPDLALDPEVSARIAVDGMRRGLFTGVKLSQCPDFLSMRRVVNGNDKAKPIAGYAEAFKAAHIKNEQAERVCAIPSPQQHGNKVAAGAVTSAGLMTGLIFDWKIGLAVFAGLAAAAAFIFILAKRA